MRAARDLGKGRWGSVGERGGVVLGCGEDGVGMETGDGDPDGKMWRSGWGRG